MLISILVPVALGGGKSKNVQSKPAY